MASAKTTSSRALALAQALDLEERALEVGHAVVFPITFFFLCFFFSFVFLFLFTASPFSTLVALVFLASTCRQWIRNRQKKKKERWQEKDLDVEPDTCKRGIPI